MSGAREIDVDELFERNADTRLLDRRRRDELGLPPVATPASPTPARFGPESMLGGDGVPLAAPRGAMLRVSLQARPGRELIPGAVVTVVAEVADDGDTDADDVRLRIAIPPEAEPIPGSFARDDIALDGEALLGEGLRVGTVPAAAAIRLRFAVRVLPGTGPLDLVAHAAAPGVPVIAAPALRLTRRSGHAAYDAPRPFFELEAGETDDDLAAVAAAPPQPERTIDTMVDEPAAPAVLASAEVLEPEPVELQEPEPEPEPSSEPAFPELELPPEPEPLPEPEPESEPSPEPAFPELELPQSHAVADVEPAPVQVFALARVLDADEVRALERVFSGAVPHGLAALALLSSVAAADGALGRALGVSEFARAVSAALPRALVAARMNRPTPPVVTPEALAVIRPDADAPDDDFAYEGALLVARLDVRELDALRALLGRALDDPFLRGVQVLLAVAPRALDGVSEDAALRARDALAAYRAAAGGWLMRVTVRRAVDRRYDPLTADDPALHDAGRALVGVLREAVS
jgi:hypothetical protein